MQGGLCRFPRWQYPIDPQDKGLEVTVVNGRRLRSSALVAGLVLIFAGVFGATAGAGGGPGGPQQQGPAVSAGPGILTPFSGVAVIPATPGVGVNDLLSAETQAEEVALIIASYVAETDEKEMLGFIDNWVLAGLEGDVTVEEAILRVPTNYPIDPADPTLGTKKVYIVEMCNPTFAKKALGLVPIVTDVPESLITDGFIHAPALPCETAVYVEGRNIRVDMLDPEAIFTLFFTDVLFGDQIQTIEGFEEELMALPATVKEEIRTIIYTALTEAQVGFEDTDRPLGPAYSSLEQVAELVEGTEYQSPYVHFGYARTDGGSFASADMSAVAAAVIEVLGGDKAGLDLTYSWKSPRPAPLPVPGNLLVEACSPENAKAALDLGLYHATALPCAITVKAVDYNADGVAELFITYLNPHFMFDAMFADVFVRLSDEELAQLEVQAAALLADLQTMVAAALDEVYEAGEIYSLGQVYYDMVPADDAAPGQGPGPHRAR